MMKIDQKKLLELGYQSDGASWSPIIEEGEPVDTAGSGATTSTIRAMNSGAGSHFMKCGDVEELWDELAKLGLGLRCCLVLMVPRLNLVPKEVIWPLGSQVVVRRVHLVQGTVSSIPIVGSISPEGFLSLILLLVVIIATVVVTVVVVVAIVGVVIVVAVIRVVVVVGGVSFIIKLSFMVIGFFYRIVFHYLFY
ncbi:hypothetical protein Tco_0600509 [Tanacetum coccineum]|uniref:Uncharacterized protein n=1 Tax=Tanacetum coccineum TaxID=301880 RepID=A0ABQ4WBY2_9ASTR